MEERSTVVRNVEAEHGSIASYSVGFGLSVLFTLLAFALTSTHKLSIHTLMVSLIGLALIQFVVQLVFFLHLGRETKPRWKRLLLFFMVIVVLILVLGSIWIMYNLSYRMTPDQMNTYMLNQAESGL